MTNKQVYEKVNEKIMDLISKGTMPWEMTWEGSTLPMNFGKQHSISWNQCLDAFCNSYVQWIFTSTFNQTKLGAVKKGEGFLRGISKKVEKKGKIMSQKMKEIRSSFTSITMYSTFPSVMESLNKVRENTPMEAEKWLDTSQKS